MKKELEDILKLNIPRIKKKSIGFLEIAGIVHHETINSAIYSYFLNSRNKELANVFKDALIKVINSKLPINNEEKPFQNFKKISTNSFNDFKSNTEIVVDEKKKNRH